MRREEMYNKEKQLMAKREAERQERLRINQEYERSRAMQEEERSRRQAEREQADREYRAKLEAEKQAKTMRNILVLCPGCTRYGTANCSNGMDETGCCMRIPK